MERLRQINQLLKADQLEEAIGELLRMADQSEARRSLLILRNRLKTLDHKKLHALIEEADWKRERQHIRRELLDILHDLDRDEAPAAPTTTPTPKGGGIFDRAVEMFRKRWPKTKPSSRPPSPRFPSRHKDKGGSIPDRSTGSSTPPTSGSCPSSTGTFDDKCRWGTKSVSARENPLFYSPKYEVGGRSTLHHSHCHKGHSE